MAQRYPSLENATNAFLIAYEQRLPTQLRVRTKVDYRNYVRQMIRHENARNPNFSAWSWVSQDQAQQVWPGVVEMYLQGHQKESSKKALKAAHGHLMSWVREAKRFGEVQRPLKAQRPRDANPPRSVAITDDQSFYKEFERYLMPDIEERLREKNVHWNELVEMIEDFKEYYKRVDPGFSLARLGNVFKASNEDLLPLPDCESWLEESFSNDESQKLAGYAYRLLMDFLENLLRMHGGGHITADESQLRIDYLHSLPYDP